MLDKSNPNSFWQPYFNSFPVPVDPTFFTEDELEALQNPALQGNIDFYSRDAENSWHVYGEDLMRVAPTRFSPELFHWARPFLFLFLLS